jgi:hypothetical protein
MVTLQLGSKPVKFLCDTGTVYSVIKKPEGPLSKEKDHYWSEGQITNLGGGTYNSFFSCDS